MLISCAEFLRKVCFFTCYLHVECERLKMFNLFNKLWNQEFFVLLQLKYAWVVAILHERGVMTNHRCFLSHTRYRGTFYPVLVTYVTTAGPIDATILLITGRISGENY